MWSTGIGGEKSAGGGKEEEIKENAAAGYGSAGARVLEGGTTRKRECTA